MTKIVAPILMIANQNRAGQTNNAVVNDPKPDVGPGPTALTPEAGRARLPSVVTRLSNSML